MPKIKVNDVELFYEFKGNPDGPTIVLVNGLLVDTTSWTPILPLFTERYRCLVYDCRGQGQSDKPDEIYEVRQHTEDLAALVEALGIERAHFVGASNGGATSLGYAADHPERVISLVTAGSVAYADALLKAKLNAWIRAQEVGGSVLRFDVSLPWVWGPKFLEENYAAIIPFRERGVGIPMDWAMNLMRGALVHDFRDKLPLIEAPVLAMVGEDDLLAPPKYARYIAEHVQHGELLVLPDRGHGASLEDPEGFGRAVFEFIERVEKGAK